MDLQAYEHIVKSGPYTGLCLKCRRHPRFVFDFVPTSCSWLNALEGFFTKLSKRRLKRGVLRAVVDLQTAINRFLDKTDDDLIPKVLDNDP